MTRLEICLLAKVDRKGSRVHDITLGRASAFRTFIACLRLKPTGDSWAVPGFFVPAVHRTHLYKLSSNSGLFLVQEMCAESRLACCSQRYVQARILTVLQPCNVRAACATDGTQKLADNWGGDFHESSFSGFSHVVHAFAGHDGNVDVASARRITGFQRL